jgi:DUF971 family protein
MQPIQIKQTSSTELLIKWDDGHESPFTFQMLRDNCPCASCKGETILFQTMRPVNLPIFSPGKYELQSVQLVGNYAIQIGWKDGHNTGIFMWEYLRELCPCQECTRQRGRETMQNYQPLV